MIEADVNILLKPNESVLSYLLDKLIDWIWNMAEVGLKQKQLFFGWLDEVNIENH